MSQLSCKIKFLILHANYTSLCSYYNDWLDAFTADHRIDAYVVDLSQSGYLNLIKKRLNKIDFIVILHSATADSLHYLKPAVPYLTSRKVKLLCFIGNEVNIPGGSIYEKRELLKEFSPEYIGTQLLYEAGNFLFGDLATKSVVPLPPALNIKMINKYDYKRDIDIGVISAIYPPHLGDNDRMRLLDYFKKHSDKLNLVSDINTQQRLDREGWLKYLSRCKGTISTEAGSWYLEKDDNTVNKIRKYIENKTTGYVIKADSSLRKLAHLLSPKFREWLRHRFISKCLSHELTVNEKIDFEEIYFKFFKNYEKPNFYGKCVSSRHFDAISTRTCQLMIEGRYNDILEPHQHYIPISPDFSNVEEAVDKFKDGEYRRRIVNTAMEHALTSHTYYHRVSQVLDLL